jgi:tetratricopeptide (TPR) repeat protein
LVLAAPRRKELSINEEATKLIEEGNNNLKSKKFEVALEAFDRVIQLDPSNDRAFIGKIKALTKLRRYSDAEEAVQEALAKLPKNIKVLDEWGSLYLNQRQYKKTVEIADQILEIDPSNEGAFVGKIIAIRELHKFLEAENLIQEALDKLPKNIEILNQWSYLYYSQKQYERAIEINNQILEIDPSNERAFVWKIASLRGLRRFTEAENLVQEALDKLPKNIEILNQWGILYYSQKQYERAIEINNQILEIDPSNERAFVWKIASLRPEFIRSHLNSISACGFFLGSN